MCSRINSKLIHRIFNQRKPPSAAYTVLAAKIVLSLVCVCEQVHEFKLTLLPIASMLLILASAHQFINEPLCHCQLDAHVHTCPSNQGTRDHTMYQFLYKNVSMTVYNIVNNMFVHVPQSQAFLSSPSSLSRLLLTTLFPFPFCPLMFCTPALPASSPPPPPLHSLSFTLPLTTLC